MRTMCQEGRRQQMTFGVAGCPGGIIDCGGSVMVTAITFYIAGLLTIRRKEIWKGKPRADLTQNLKEKNK